MNNGLQNKRVSPYQLTHTHFKLEFILLLIVGHEASLAGNL